MFRRACDLLFAAACIVPGILLYAGEPALAVMAFMTLMLGGAVSGIADPEAPHRTVAAPRAPGTRRIRAVFRRTAAHRRARPTRAQAPGSRHHRGRNRPSR